MTNTIAMQIRCVHCGLEQYAPAVSLISKGREPCCWCGEYSVEMTEEEYRKRIRILREKQQREYDAQQSVEPL
jgi:hypothetical protein